MAAYRVAGLLRARQQENLKSHQGAIFCVCSYSDIPGCEFRAAAAHPATYWNTCGPTGCRFATGKTLLRII